VDNKEKLEVILDDRFPETLQNILVDGKKISRILSHLVENAIKCTDCGYIVLGCETPHEKMLRFWVEDTGKGINQEDFDSIFKRFWKQGDAFTQQTRGLGIGLSLCKELIELMNGHISVSSSAGYGSTFEFTINY
jgi:signal transduction histidine kinase